MRQKKITWDVLYKEFRKKYPKLAGEVLYWHPSNFLEIMLYLKNGQKITYEYMKKEVQFLAKTWK